LLSGVSEPCEVHNLIHSAYILSTLALNYLIRI